MIFSLNLLLIFSFSFLQASLNNNDPCKDFANNERRTFKIRDFSQPSRLRYGYSIQKSGESLDYSLGFNPTFRGPLAKKLESNYKKCFVDKDYRLSTPSHLILKIYDDSRAPKIIIESKPRPPAFRNQWVLKMNCSWMAHELLHWAQLNDEYIYGNRQQPKYFCRENRLHNIMMRIPRNHEYRHRILEDQFYKIIYPNCRSKSDYNYCLQFTGYYRTGRSCNNVPESCKD